MIDEATRAELERIRDEAARQHERLNNLEKKVEDLAEMNLNIQRIAINTEQLSKDLSKVTKSIDNLDTRMGVIEQKPGQAWNNMTRTIFTAVISTIAGGLAVGLIQLIAL